MSTPQRPNVQVDTAQILRDMYDRGWNQAELARRAKVNEATVSLFLRGERQSPKTLRKIASALKRSPSDYIAITAAA